MAPVIKFDTFHNIVNGELRGAKQVYHGLDPTTGDKLWDAPVASKQDVEDAVVAARRAFKPWARTPFEERVSTLRKFADAVKPHLDDFTELILKENGKPVSLGDKTYPKVVLGFTAAVFHAQSVLEAKHDDACLETFRSCRSPFCWR